SMSCHVTDLGVTFVTRFTDSGTEPVTEAKPDDPPADIRLTASSDDVISLSATPANIARMWLSGRVKVQASMRDLLALRKLHEATYYAMGELILLRHGETEWSLAGRHTGRTDIPLTTRGEAAARALAPLLARRDIVAVFTSPARRAVTTAALAGLDNAKPDPDLWEW